MVEDFSVGFEKFVTGGAACGVIVVDVAATGEEPSVSDSFAEACCLSSSILSVYFSRACRGLGGHGVLHAFGCPVGGDNGVAAARIEANFARGTGRCVGPICVGVRYLCTYCCGGGQQWWITR